MKFEDSKLFINYYNSLFEVPGIVLIVSEDPYRRAEIVKFIFQKSGEWKINTVSSEENFINNFGNETSCFGLFENKKKIIFINDIVQLNKAELKFLKETITLQRENIKFVLGSSAEPLKDVVSIVEKLGVIFYLNKEKPWEKEKRIKTKISQIVASCDNKKIEPEALALLVLIFSPEEGILISEMKKLLCYVKDQNMITLADVEAIVCGTKVVTFSKLLDCLMKGEIEIVLEMLGDICYDNRVAEPLNLIKYLRACFKADSFISKYETKGKVIRRNSILVLLNEVEVRIKSLPVNSKLILEIFLISLYNDFIFTSKCARAHK